VCVCVVEGRGGEERYSIQSEIPFSLTD
jgi:hypothetical protein